MKSLNVFKLLVLQIVFLMSVSAFAGERDRGGGNVIAARFVTYGSAALRFLKYVEPRLTDEAINQVISGTSVFDVDSIQYQDPNTGEILSRDAEYDPTSHTIRFNRNHFINFSCREKLAISAHEYLRAAGLESSSYALSNAFLSDQFTGDKTVNERLGSLVDKFCLQNL